MMKISYIIYLVWLLLVILWNFLYPQVPPIYDVIAAVILSIITVLLKKLFKTYFF